MYMLAFNDFGTGPAVLLLHGFPLDHTIWEHQVDRLSANYRVVVPDLPGMGNSPPLPSAIVPSISLLAEQVLSLMDARKIGEAAVVGHSMGGYIALAMYHLAPERVTGLAFVCSQALPDTPEARHNRYELIRAVQEQGPAAAAEAMLPKLFAPSVPADSPLRQQVDTIIRRTPAQGIKAALLAMARRPDMTPYLYEVDVPTLVLIGDQDRATPPERSLAIKEALPHARVVQVPGAGHMPMLEAPDAVSNALEQWLAEVYGTISR